MTRRARIATTAGGSILALAVATFFLAPRTFNTVVDHEPLASVRRSQLSNLLELYRLDNGFYPTTEQGLLALVRAPETEPRPRAYPEGGYVGSDLLIDPWHRPYQYARYGRGKDQHYELNSLGDPDAANQR